MKDIYNKNRPSSSSLNYVRFCDTFENEISESSDLSELDTTIPMEIDTASEKKMQGKNKFYHIKTRLSFRLVLVKYTF